MDDSIWDNTKPYNVSLDNMSGIEDLVNIDGTTELIATTTTLTSCVYDKIWYSTHAECDSWYNVPETMYIYQEWDNPPNILEDTSPYYEPASDHIKPDFYIDDCSKPIISPFITRYYILQHMFVKFICLMPFCIF